MTDELEYYSCKKDQNMNEELTNFLNNHKTVYIYGYSENHKLIKRYIEQNGFRIEGYIVSKSHQVDECNVHLLNDVEATEENVGIIIAVQSKYYNEIIPSLICRKYSIDDLYFLDLAERNTIYALFGENQVYEAEDYRDIVRRYFYYSKEIIRKCNNDCFYMYCVHFDLGDLVQIFQMDRKFLEKYEAPIFYFINKNQRPIAEMCYVKNYLIVDKIDLQGMMIDKSQESAMNIQMFETVFMSLPVKGIPFVIPFMIRFRSLLKEDIFSQHFMNWMGYNYQKISSPKILDISDSLRAKIQKYNLDKIALIAPEANSMETPKMDFWMKLAKYLENLGYIVVTNAVNKMFFIPDTIDLNLSLKELLELSGNCGIVYSMRSGLCDCISGRTKEFNIFYWTSSSAEYFGIKNNYQIGGENIHEWLIDSFCL